MQRIIKDSVIPSNTDKVAIGATIVSNRKEVFDRFSEQVRNGERYIIQYLEGKTKNAEGNDVLTSEILVHPYPDVLDEIVDAAKAAYKLLNKSRMDNYTVKVLSTMALVLALLGEK